MSLLFDVYSASPVFLQNWVCSIKGLLICRRRYNRNFFTELEKYSSGYYNQAEELVKFLYSVKDMGIYAPYLSNVNWADLKRNTSAVYDIIHKFPVIDKKLVKNNLDAFNNHSFVGSKIEMRTSGTTGGGLVFPYSVDMENRQWAVWWRYRMNLGINLDTLCGWFGGKRIVPNSVSKPPFWRMNKPGRQVLFSSYHLSEKTVIYYYNEIKRRGIKWLHGYPSHISRFASFIINAGLEPMHNICFVTTGAENVIANQKSIMEAAFPNAVIRQHYGLNEGVANISQDKNGEWIADDDFCFVEFIPVAEPNGNSNQYHIVGTGFSNYAFPLIRYDTGDLAKFVDGKIVSIDGRTSNVIKLPNGSEICEASLSIILHDFNNIVEAQFHQKSLSVIELWLVKGKRYCATDENLLMHNLHETFGNDASISIKYVGSVERTISGKMKLVISEL